MYPEEAVEDHLLYLQHERSATPATVRTHGPSLRRFMDWLRENGHPAARIQDLEAAGQQRISTSTRH
jgi:hypothetical protein